MKFILAIIIFVVIGTVIGIVFKIHMLKKFLQNLINMLKSASLYYQEDNAIFLMYSESCKNILNNKLFKFLMNEKDYQLIRNFYNYTLISIQPLILIVDN